MNIKKYLSLVTGVAFAAVAITSCVQKDEWETPPIKCENKFPSPNISLADFKAQAPATGYLLITNDQIFDGYVISSDESGNFYKTISFQDKAENPTAGLQIEVEEPGEECNPRIQFGCVDACCRHSTDYIHNSWILERAMIVARRVCAHSCVKPIRPTHTITFPVPV